ncbi:uncharacterized protein BDV17DRAFT_295780 [Aspergillus undulatus]|uniref:uncharacterized protein n=1 Tax=Aspergillus undulatus TaxID=1810928 RepID=UPI003CCCE000
MPNLSVIITPGAWHIPAHYAKLTTLLSRAGFSARAVPLPTVNSNPPLELGSGHDVVALGEAAKGLGKEERLKQGHGQMHMGQMVPVGPEEEEIERRKPEMMEFGAQF